MTDQETYRCPSKSIASRSGVGIELTSRVEGYVYHFLWKKRTMMLSKVGTTAARSFFASKIRVSAAETWTFNQK